MSTLKINRDSWVSSTWVHRTVLIGELSKGRAWRGRERHLEVGKRLWMRNLRTSKDYRQKKVRMVVDGDKNIL